MTISVRKLLSGLEVRRWILAGELEGARIGKIWRRGNIFVFEVSGAGKKFLIVRPGAIYLADYAPRGEADSFCMYLRKRFSGKKVEKVEQVGSDRIVKLSFPELDLILELFSTGNIIVVDKEGIIQNAFVQRKWSSREIRRGIPYTPPPFLDWLSMEKKKVVELIRGKSKAEVAKLLGLGRKVEKYWSENPEEFVERIFEEASKPLSSDEIEREMKAEDERKLVEEELRKREGKIKALEKSAEELQRKIEEYERKARIYRKAGDYIFQHLHEVEGMIERARRNGEKKIKVSLPIDECDST